MAWDQTKPVYKSPLISNDIRDNWAALYNTFSVDHDFTTGTHKALILPDNGLTVGSTLKLTSNKVLVGYSVDQDGTSLLQVNGTGYFTYGLKFGDGTTQTTASPSTSYVASTYATKISPNLTGVPKAPTAAQNTNTTQIATTAYYINQAGVATPSMDGTAYVGTSYLFARQDHRHPTDTSNFSAAAPLMDGVASAGTLTTYARSNHIHPTDTSRAPIDSPNFTGVPLVPTAALGTNTTQAASTAFVKATIDSIIGAAPGTLDTLNELAAALGNDPNFAATITNSIASKFAIAGGSFTGSIGIISGSASSPSLYISGDNNTGFYAPLAGKLGITLGGTSKVIFSSAGDTLQVAGSVNSTGGYVFPDGKAQLKAFQGLQNNGTNVAQRSRINFVGPYVSLSDDSINDISTVTIGGNQGVPTVQYFSGNNSQTVFTLSDAPLSKDYTSIHIGGTYVPKSAYTLVGTSLTFTTAPAIGTNNIEVEWIAPLSVLIPANNTVSSLMLVDNISLRGAPTAPTASVGQNDLQIVNTACLKANLNNLGSMSLQNSTDVSVTKIGIGLGSASAPSLYFTGDTNTGIWSPTTDTIAVSVAGSEALRLTTSGSLFIGRTAYAAGSERMSVAGTGVFGSASYTIIGDDGTNSIVGSYSNKDFIIKTNNTSVARFTSTGNLLIGTAIDDGVNKLQVNGGISAPYFVSSVATGTAPFTVASSTMVTNLNAEMLGGTKLSNLMNTTSDQNVLGVKHFYYAGPSPSKSGVRVTLYDTTTTPPSGTVLEAYSPGNLRLQTIEGGTGKTATIQLQGRNAYITGDEVDITGGFKSIKSLDGAYSIIDATSIGRVTITGSDSILDLQGGNGASISSPQITLNAEMMGVAVNGPLSTSGTTTIPDLKALQVTSPARSSIRPSLLLDFANSKMLDPRITFTRASTATYFDAHGVIRTAEVNQPRFDHDPITGECKGLLIEESRTNLLTYSEQFEGTAPWAEISTTYSSNSAVAPDGATTADKIIINSGAASSSSAIYNSIAKSAVATTYTCSFYAKAAEFNSVRSVFRDTADAANNATVYFNVATGVVATPSIGGTFTGLSYGIIPVSNGWYRCWITVTSGTETSIQTRFFIYNNGTSPVTGDGVSGLYLWGVQVEAGAFPTSYIPTTSAQVTRAADSAVMTGANFSSWYRQDEGTFVADGGSSYGSWAGAGSTRYLTCSDGTNNERIICYGISVTIISGGITVGLAGTGSDSLTYKKRAFGIKLNDGYFASGTVLAADTTFSLAVGVNQMQIGCNSPTTSTTFLNGHIARIAYYPKRLTNAELQGLSTL